MWAEGASAARLFSVEEYHIISSEGTKSSKPVSSPSCRKLIVTLPHPPPSHRNAPLTSIPRPVIVGMRGQLSNDYYTALYGNKYTPPLTSIRLAVTAATSLCVHSELASRCTTSLLSAPLADALPAGRGSSVSSITSSDRNSSARSSRAPSGIFLSSAAAAAAAASSAAAAAAVVAAAAEGAAAVAAAAPAATPVVGRGRNGGSGS